MCERVGASVRAAGRRRTRSGWRVRAAVAGVALPMICAGAVWAQPSAGGARLTDLGTPATPEEIEAWGPIVGPDGEGLPAGGGTAAEGRALYDRRCAACHGPTGQEGPDDRLAGGQGSLAGDGARKTVGSYWPAATTLWDYVNRAMPFNQPGSLSTDEVYAVVAYVLHLNGLVGEDDLIDARTLPQVEMPNRDGFVPDARPDVGVESGVARRESPAAAPSPTVARAPTPAPSAAARRESPAVAPPAAARRESPVVAPSAAVTRGSAPASPAPAARSSVGSVIEGVFTPAQASRGERTFRDVCAACHDTGEFSGGRFRISWVGRPVGELFETISTLMPEADPGSLSPAEYAAIVAYLLQVNGYPAGEVDLPTSARSLGQLEIVSPPAP